MPYEAPPAVGPQAVCVVVYANAITESVACREASLIGRVPENVAAFVQVNGDAWVSRMVTGAEYIAVYVFQSQTAKQAQSVVNILAANGIWEGGGLESGLQAALALSCSQMRVGQGFRQFMSGHFARPLPERSDVIGFAQRFGEARPDVPAVLSFETTGYEMVPGLGEVVTRVHGAEGAEGAKALLLGPQEMVNFVCGNFGEAVQRVKVMTNKGNSVSWPAASDGAVGSFSWSAGGGSVFLGFCGRAGAEVDQLGVVTLTLAPAVWG